MYKVMNLIHYCRKAYLSVSGGLIAEHLGFNWLNREARNQVMYVFSLLDFMDDKH